MNPFHWLSKSNIKHVDKAMVTTLSRAVRSGDMSEIRHLLREGVRSDSEDTSGSLPICVAAETGNAQALELFLADSSPNAIDHGRPPLFFSAAQLHQDCIKLLIEAGADTNLATSRHKYFRRDFSELGSTPLHAALLAYTPASRTTMDRRIPEAIDLPPDVQRKKEVCIELLLEAGSNPAIQNDQGISPLNLALDSHKKLFLKHKEQCKVDCILVNPEKSWPVFIASRIRATGLVAFGINSEESIEEWKSDLLQKSTSKVLLLAEGCGIGSGLKRWYDESALDLRYNLDKSIIDFETIESIWYSISRYLDLPGHQNDSLFGLRNRPKQYDFFISYKSENVIPTRKLADTLLQNGQRVWMAEYEVLLTGQSAFQMAINEGLAASRKAIFFSNSRFAESAYCQIEVLLALQLIRDSDILEIRIPDEQHCFSSLFQTKQIRELVWDDKKPDESVFAVCELLVLPKFTAFIPENGYKDSQIKLEYRDLCISLTIGKWQVQPVELNLWENVSTTVAEFTMLPTVAKLTGRLMIMEASFGIPVSENGNSEFDMPLDDDRELARITRRCFANQHRFTHQFECKGAHTWLWNGKMMPAFTWFQAPHLIEPYEVSDTTIDNSWNLVRQYSVIVDHPVSGIPLECRFQFIMRDGADNMDTRFREFLQQAKEMEQIASSLSLSQQRAGSASCMGRTSESVERAVHRAIALMTLVQRAYTEDEYAQAGTVRKRILGELLKPVNAWIEHDEIARYLSPREQKYLSMPLGSWSLYVRMEQRYRQSQVPVLLWYSGIEPRPVIATHPPHNIYDKVYFSKVDGWRLLVERAKDAKKPLCGCLSDFAVAALMALTRLRSIRRGVRHNPRLIKDVEEILKAYHWPRPLDKNLFQTSSSGDLYVDLFNRPIEQLTDFECGDVESYLQNQLCMCDNLGIPSPGTIFRSQYAADDNLNRLLSFTKQQHISTWEEEMWT